ncbi:MAG: hypothetical protein J7M26_04445, partial [Armatimonadetes bacterium]|nr:hypothetical protein [Armatimonadota bacterium]
SWPVPMWGSFVLPYLGNARVLICPDVYKPPLRSEQELLRFAVIWGGYGLNDNLTVKRVMGRNWFTGDETWVPVGVSIDDVELPSDCLLACDTSIRGPDGQHPFGNPVDNGAFHVWWCVDTQRWNDWVLPYHDNPPHQFAWRCLPADRHNGGANVLFVDGHVKWLSLQRLTTPANAQQPEMWPLWFRHPR